jgi:hypothetical protein
VQVQVAHFSAAKRIDANQGGDIQFEENQQTPAQLAKKSLFRRLIYFI